jgi:hypothetical protein
VCCCHPLLLSPVAAEPPQAEAAAKLAQYQQGLRQLLSDIGKTGNIADDAQLLYKLADQLFGSPLNVCELVGQGGVPVIVNAARSARQALVGDAARADVLPALMQVGACRSIDLFMFHSGLLLCRMGHFLRRYASVCM